MDNITNTMTARLTVERPSRFAMPACGHVSEWTILRDPKAVVTGSTKGDMGLAQGYFPGNPAWRPPIS